MNEVERKQAYLEKTTAEIRALEAQGILMGGNAFSQVVVVKGDAEPEGRAPLTGPDATALKASFKVLGYAPEDWCFVLAYKADGSPLSAQEMRMALTTLNPARVVICDEAAAEVVRNAYADELSARQDMQEALLAPGTLVTLLGVLFMNLGGFEQMLESPQTKRIAWDYLQKVPAPKKPY